MIKYILAYLTTLLLFFHAHAVELPHRGFFGQASLLYWQAEENGLAYAIKSTSPTHVKGSAQNIPFDWDVGFNVGLGYRIPHDTWACLLQFTSLQTHSDQEQSGSVFFPLWALPTSFYADHVKAHWRLHLGLIDLLLSKPFTPTPTLTLTPFLGLRYGSLRQKFNIDYLGGTFPPLEEISIRMKNKFEGIGPYAALAADYALPKNFSLFAKGAFSLLYGEFYLHQDEDTLGTKQKLLGNHFIFRTTAPFLETTAGLRWHHSFTTLKKLTLDLAWDQNLYFSQNQLLRFLDSTSQGLILSNQGDLSIAGVHFTFRLDF